MATKSAPAPISRPRVTRDAAARAALMDAATSSSVTASVAGDRLAGRYGRTAGSISKNVNVATPAARPPPNTSDGRLFRRRGTADHRLDQSVSSAKAATTTAE